MLTVVQELRENSARRLCLPLCVQGRVSRRTSRPRWCVATARAAARSLRPVVVSRLLQEGVRSVRIGGVCIVGRFCRWSSRAKAHRPLVIDASEGRTSPFDAAMAVGPSAKGDPSPLLPSRSDRPSSCSVSSLAPSSRMCSPPLSPLEISPRFSPSPNRSLFGALAFASQLYSWSIARTWEPCHHHSKPHY